MSLTLKLLEDCQECKKFVKREGNTGIYCQQEKHIRFYQIIINSDKMYIDCSDA